MVALLIQDENLARRLLDIAAKEHRRVEDVLESLLAVYEAPRPPEDPQETLRRVRHKAYAKARRYWQDAGDTAKAALTDEALDEQFWLFDAEGIPRLKVEQAAIELPPNSLVRLAELAELADIHSEHPIDPMRADEILNQEYADYLLKRMGGVDDDAD